MSTFMNTATTNTVTAEKINPAFEMGMLEGSKSVYTGSVPQTAEGAWDALLQMVIHDAKSEYVFDDAFEQHFLDGWAAGQKDAAS